MKNKEFLKTIRKSFDIFLKTGARSNKKLKVLHGEIAKILQEKLGGEYQVKSLGYGDGKEYKMEGRYNPKAVDITIIKNNIDIAGIAVKFVMNNYSQNSNNYFENMLGETANIRSNQKKYFQIFILAEEMPYYKVGNIISNWEKLTIHNLKKYIKLSKDDTERYFHTPDKTLIFIIKFPELDKTKILSKKDYKNFYLSNNENILLSNKDFGDFGKSIIFNDFEKFIDKIFHTIKSL